MIIKNPITISKIRINITPRVTKNIVAFAELELVDADNNIFFKVRGYTIKVKSFGNKPPVFVVDAPAYPSAFKYVKSFIVEDKNLWFELEKETLSEFSDLVGGKTPDDYLAESEEIDIDEIEKELSKQ